MPVIARLKFAILGWAGATLFFSAILAVSDLGAHEKPLAFLLYANAVHFGLWLFALPLLSRSTRAFPLNEGKRLWNSAVLLLIVAVLASFIVLIQWAIVFPASPYHNSHSTLWSFLESELVRFLPNDILIGIVVVIALECWRVLLDFQAERIRATDLERRLAVSRLDALRMQLHPHFLFNTLHTIAGLIIEQPASARRMVIAVGDLLRLTLRDTGNSVRSLAEELEFADLYLGIEKLRLGDRLVLDYDIESEATSAEVPQLLLQPLFENAVRHGAARTLDSCEIRFRAYRQGDRLYLALQNDGAIRSRSAEPPPFGLGLTNTMDRLQLHYQDQFTFQYSDRPQGGVQIELSIPYTKANHTTVNRSEELYAATSAHTHADRR